MLKWPGMDSLLLLFLAPRSSKWCTGTHCFGFPFGFLLLIFIAIFCRRYPLRNLLIPDIMFHLIWNRAVCCWRYLLHSDMNYEKYFDFYMYSHESVISIYMISVYRKKCAAHLKNTVPPRQWAFMSKCYFSISCRARIALLWSLWISFVYIMSSMTRAVLIF